MVNSRPYNSENQHKKTRRRFSQPVSQNGKGAASLAPAPEAVGFSSGPKDSHTGLGD